MTASETPPDVAQQEFDAAVEFFQRVLFGKLFEIGKLPEI